jgi:hypothetical protein
MEHAAATPLGLPPQFPTQLPTAVSSFQSHFGERVPAACSSERAAGTQIIVPLLASIPQSRSTQMIYRRWKTLHASCSRAPRQLTAPPPPPQIMLSLTGEQFQEISASSFAKLLRVISRSVARAAADERSAGADRGLLRSDASSTAMTSSLWKCCSRATAHSRKSSLPLPSSAAPAAPSRSQACCARFALRPCRRRGRSSQRLTCRSSPTVSRTNESRPAVQP